MRKPFFIIFLAIIMVATTTATANTGRFTSFSTTVTRTPGQLNFNVGINTTGSISPGTTDIVIVLGVAMPTTATGYGPSITTIIPRTGIGVGAFGSSFSVTGVDDNASYKWLTLALGDIRGTGYGYYGVYFAFYFLYYGCLPIGTTTPLFITTPAGTGTIPITCTTTSPAPNGPLYNFLNSNVDTFNTTINWWYYPTTAGSPYPVVAHGLSTGRIGALAAIPTLSSWGFLFLGTLLGMTGFILLRRG